MACYLSDDLIMSAAGYAFFNSSLLVVHRSVSPTLSVVLDAEHCRIHVKDR